MSNWIVREGAPSIDVNLEKNSLVFRLRRSLSIEAQDRLVLLSYSDSAAFFSHRATVVRVQKESGEEGVRVYRVEVDEWMPLDRKLERDDFAYSLTIVRNLQKPYLHFLQGYRRLPNADYESLLRGEPFLARTVFLDLWFSLPNDLQREVRAANELDLDYVEENAPFSVQLGRLIDFLRTRVISVGGQLLDIAANWDSLVSDAKSARRIEPIFYDEEDPHRSINVLRQAELFGELRAELGVQGEAGYRSDITLLDVVLHEISEPTTQQSEARFEDVFGEQR